MIKMGFEKELFEIIENLQKSKGLDNLTSKIIARLFVEPEEISMDDIAKETGYSLASVSNKLKMLEQAGFVQRKTKPGTKKVYLYMEKNFLKALKGLFIKFQQMQMSMLRIKIPELINKYKSKLKTEKEKKQMEMLEEYYKDFLKIDKMMQEFAQKLNELQ